MLGITQSLIHLFSDRDRVPLPVRKVVVDAKTGAAIKPVETPTAMLRNAAPGILFRLIWTAALFPVLAFILYISTPLRSIAWSLSFDILRFIYFLPPRQRNTYTGFTPILPFYFATVSQTTLLVLLWEITNAAFSAYIAQPPVRRGVPLTSDTKSGKALDANGSLISGLRSKKAFARQSAFYELLLIAYEYRERRRTIYADIERVGGSTAWTQISTLCLAQLEGLNSRIQALNPTPPSQQPAVQETDIKERQRIAPPLKTGNVFAATTVPLSSLGTPARTGEWAKSVARSYGSSPGAEPAKDIARFASRHLLSEEQREALARQPQVVEKKVEGVWDSLIRSPLGWAWRCSFERRVVGVLGREPVEEVGVVCDAIDALSKLAVEAVKEDVYGQVSTDVPGIMRTYLCTLKAVQTFMREVQQHWSDSQFEERARGEVKSANALVEALGDGLAGLMAAYAEYYNELQIGATEVKEMKSAFAEVQRAKAARAASASGSGRQGEKPKARLNGTAAPAAIGGGGGGEQQGKRRDLRREMEEVRSR